MNIVKVYPDGNRSRSMTVAPEAVQSSLDQLAANYDEVIERGEDYVIVSGGFRFEVEA